MKLRAARATFVLLIATLSSVGLATMPAKAATTVRVDAVTVLTGPLLDGIVGQNYDPGIDALTPIIGPTCDYTSVIECTEFGTGAGVTIPNARAWTLTYSITIRHYYFHNCFELHPILRGSWKLSAVDLSGDSLSGTFAGSEFDWHWIVSGGTGAYAGATDATGTGTRNDLSNNTAVDQLIFGPGCGTDFSPMRVGSLELNIQ